MLRFSTILFAAFCWALPAVAQPVGELVEGLECASDPTQTYSLYLPSNFTPERKWPVMLVMDPRSQSVRAAERFIEAAEEYGWILLSSDNTASDGLADNSKAVNALWAEIHDHYPIDRRRIYTAGFSGTAMLSWILGRATGGLAGVIGTGGRFTPETEHQKIDFACFGTAGITDFNYSEMVNVHERLKRWGTPERFEVFDGPHIWMPPELAREGVEWMELQAMKENRRDRDPELVERLFAKDMGKAAELESSGRQLDAHRRYEAIVSTFDGLRDVSEPKSKAAKLAKSPELEAMRKERKRWDRFEQKSLASIRAVLERVRNGPTLGSEAPRGSSMSSLRLAKDLQLADLRKRGELDTYEGAVAQRLVAIIAANTSFYLPREFLARRDYASAAKVLTIGTELRPNRPDIWYNYACALARIGSKKEAIAALEKSVETGWTAVEHLKNDPDLESLHGTDGFRAVVARLGG